MKFAKTAAAEAAIVRKPLNNLVGNVNGLDCDSDLYVPVLAVAPGLDPSQVGGHL